MELPYYVPTNQHGVCKQRSDQGALDYQTIFSVFIVIFAVVLMAISSYCLCRQWNTDNEDQRRRRHGTTPE